MEKELGNNSTKYTKENTPKSKKPSKQKRDAAKRRLNKQQEFCPENQQQRSVKSCWEL